MAGILSQEDVDAIAARVAELIMPDRGVLMDTAQTARLLGVTPEWVRGHAAELGGTRLGDGPRSPLRFDERRVMEAIDRRRLACEQPARQLRRRPGPRRQAADVDLLPLP